MRPLMKDSSGYSSFSCASFLVYRGNAVGVKKLLLLLLLVQEVRARLYVHADLVACARVLRVAMLLHYEACQGTVESVGFLLLVL